MTIDEIKEIDIVSFLVDSGYEVAKSSGNKTWFSSPLRSESDASFCVFSNSNMYKDFGSSDPRGDIIDLVRGIEGCDVQTAINILSSKSGVKKHDRSKTQNASILVLERVESTFTDDRIVSYMRSRRVPEWAYESFCAQVTYRFREEEGSFIGVGFKNDSGGYEIRNSIHKYATIPKDITTIGGGYDVLNIFEGWVDYLSALYYYHTYQLQGTTIVLNGLGMLYRVLPKLNLYRVINLYLDKGESADNHIDLIRSRNKNCYDHRYLYTTGKDFNEFICGIR